MPNTEEEFTTPATLQDFFTQPKELALDPAVSNYWTPDRKMSDYNRAPFTPEKLNVAERYVNPSSASGAVKISPFTADEIAYIRHQKDVSDKYFARQDIIEKAQSACAGKTGAALDACIASETAKNPRFADLKNDTAWANAKHLHPLSYNAISEIASSELPTEYTGESPAGVSIPSNNYIYNGGFGSWWGNSGATGAYIAGGKMQHFADGGSTSGSFGDAQDKPFSGVPSPFMGQRGAFNIGSQGDFGNKADVGYQGVDPNETYRTGSKPGEYNYYPYHANGPYQGMFFAQGGMPNEEGEEGEESPHEYAAELQRALQSVTDQTQDSGGRYLKGPGDGMSDEIPSVIDGHTPAALSDGEFVISADVVSGLGNGSSDAGAKILHKLMDRVRKARTGTTEQAPKVNAEKLLPKIK